ncbi:type II secretion system F family protein [Phycicoccus endophyticus]|uniref:Type II secretion system F family protein n=1 Tax=Phycicoccus endophyticus TaxID=1690220 RepID=A0A7G9R0U0_9MICO|nr:type II secretion system F family protein [Phycicoccus endophyticus]NHI19506.1 type II secretion protein F [Phycicoccus endophyticus]QNN49215.1 type II secretion system F family protein [Phycicoccus endophyticus]GGL39702.1 membrane protein [Phycicoccus endophyticus]
MTVGLILAGALAAVLFFVLALRSFVGVARDRRAAEQAAELLHTEEQSSLVEVFDQRLVRTRLGRWLAHELDLAGLKQRPVVVLVSGVVVGIVTTYLLWRFVAPLLGVAGLAIGVLAVRRYLQRAQTRRKEAFVAQLPELARVLANASHAGLSLPTALAVAGDELSEPARSELARVATRLNFGAPLDTALHELYDRIGSRETNVLMSTLVVSARSGGSLVTALRDIAETLDQRKETRREVATTLSQAIASSNLVIVMGFAMLLLVNAIEPGTVDRMTREPVGQVALVLGGSLFATGYIVIRRMTGFDR